MLHHHHRNLQVRREFWNNRLQRLGSARGTCQRHNLAARIVNCFPRGGAGALFSTAGAGAILPARFLAAPALGTGDGPAGAETGVCAGAG